MRISNNGNIGLNSPAANLNDNITIGAIVNDAVTQRYISIRGKSTDSATTVSGFACLQWSGENSEVPYTTDSVTAYSAQSYTPGTNQTLTYLYGFHASAGLTGATNNYGFYSNIASGTGRWNFYANGTAKNYFAGTSYWKNNSTSSASVTGFTIDVDGDGAFTRCSRGSTGETSHAFVLQPQWTGWLH